MHRVAPMAGIALDVDAAVIQSEAARVIEAFFRRLFAVALGSAPAHIEAAVLHYLTHAEHRPTHWHRAQGAHQISEDFASGKVHHIHPFGASDVTASLRVTE